MATERRVLVLAPAGPAEFNGIGDYAWLLAQALGATRAATLVVRGASASRASSWSTAHVHGVGISSWRDLLAPSWRELGAESDSVFVQYFPQAYVAPDFDALIEWLRIRQVSGRHTTVTLHEYWPHASASPRRMLMRWRSRRALRQLTAVTSAFVVSQPYSRAEVAASGLVPAARLHVVPVGSAVPRRQAMATPFASEAPVLVMFGQPAMMRADAVRAVARWVVSSPSNVHLSWFSRSLDELRAWWSTHVAVTHDRIQLFGGLSSDDLSMHFSRASAGLALYVDGASTRRSSLAALLEHGLPIVGLDDRYTDARVRNSGAFALVRAGDGPALVGAVDRVMSDAPRRHAMAEAAGHLFERDLSWPRIAAAYDALEAGR